MRHGTANIRTLKALYDHCGSCFKQTKEGKLVEARPLGLRGWQLRHRMKCAWLAFAGKCDLLRWPEGQ